MASLPLKARIACVVAVPVIGLLLLTAVALVSQHRQGEKFAQVSAHASVATSAQNVTALVFRLRAITLAYLMSPGEAGAAEFRRVHDETREALARLDRQARALGGAPAGELTASLEALGGAFDQIVVARGRLGRSEEDGLNLELRRAADEIQALAQNEVQREMPSLARTVGSSLLRLRLAELEFRMTRQPGSAGVLEREYEALLRNVKGFDLSPAVTERLTAALPRYHATFRAWQDGAGEEDRARAGVESAVERAVTAATDFRSAAERGERRNAEEARAVQEGLRQLAIVACVLVLLLCGSVAFVVARSIGTPLARFHAAMRAIAEGDHAAPVPGTWRRDEVGSMARTLLQFRDDIVDRRRLSERQQTLDEGARLRAERIEREIATFGETLDGCCRARAAT